MEIERLIPALRDKLGSPLGLQTVLLHHLHSRKGLMKEPRLVSEADLAVLRVNAITDPLTGLYNRRFLVDHLSREISRAERSGGILAVGMMDLKGFKSINDRMGHPVGDSVLVRTARVVRESLRAVDAGCRWGGDEFVLVLPNTDMISALAVVERVREKIADIPLSDRAAAPLDLHYGVASYPNDGKSTDFLLKIADLRLYQCRSQSSFEGSERRLHPRFAPEEMSLHMEWKGPARAAHGARRRRQLRRHLLPREAGREVASALEGRDRPEARPRAPPDPAQGPELRALAGRRASGSAAPMSDRRGAFAAHRAAASGLFTLFTLIAIVLASRGRAPPRARDGRGARRALPPDARERPRVARRLRRAAGDDRGPRPPLLRDVADRRALSPYALLLPAGVALSWHCEGKPAARFFAVASVMGVAALATLARVPTDSAAALFALAGVALAAPALLVTLEVASAAAPAAEPTPGREAPIPKVRRRRRSRPRAGRPASPERDPRGRDPPRPALSALGHPRLHRPHPGGRPARRASQPRVPRQPRARDRARRASGRNAGVACRSPRRRLPQNADLVEILGSLATAYRLSHGGRIRIEFIAERPQLPVAADPVALQRAFRNVLDNAIKYTPDAGEVRIRAGAAGSQAFVVVKDTGMGMSPEESARAFDYAFRGSGAVASGRRGKGLGLAVTKEILEANGGKISLSSEAGYGSEVTIMLPFQRGAR